ncbi:MAG: hypothetical protein AB1465_01935 [Patescibacteria group bacterium]
MTTMDDRFSFTKILVTKLEELVKTDRVFENNDLAKELQKEYSTGSKSIPIRHSGIAIVVIRLLQEQLGVHFIDEEHSPSHSGYDGILELIKIAKEFLSMLAM